MDLGTLVAGVAERTPVRVVAGDPARRVCDLTDDSRTVVPHSLFVARRGRASDGASFIDDAARAGAMGVVVSPEDAERVPAGHGLAVVVADDLPLATAWLAELFCGEPSEDLRLIGVTGTNGKSTVAHLCRGLLRGVGVRCGLVGTIEVDDGVEQARASLTTPGAIELSRTLGVMREAGCAAAALEVSSHALDQHRASALRFAVAVFTNLGDDHVDYHGSHGAYLLAKRALFDRLSPDAVAVVNADDPHAERMIERCAASVVRCALGDSSTYGDAGPSRAFAVPSRDGVTLDGPWGRVEVDTPLVGDHNAMNLLQAFAASWVVAGGFDAARAQLCSAPSRVDPPAGRLEPMHAGADDIRVFVDYAHTPDAYERTLAVLRSSMPAGARLWVVFGCGGDRERGKRPEFGRVSSSLADRVIVTTDNPRTERPSGIVDEILGGVPRDRRDRVQVHPDRRVAIETAVGQAQPGDVVALLGKGHETYQLMPDGRGGVSREAFDERAHAVSALERRRRERSGSVA